MADEITAENGERPEWLNETFASPEDQAKAYNDAVREMKRAQSDANQLRQDMDRQAQQFADSLSAFDQQQPAQQWNPQTDPTINAYQRALEEGDAASALAIQMQVSEARTAQMLDDRLRAFEERMSPQQHANQEATLLLAEQQIAPEFGDRWPEVAAQINDTVRGRLAGISNPSVEAYAQAIRESAQLAEYDRLVKEQGRLDAERMAKLNAQTMNGSTARTPTDTDAKKAEWVTVPALLLVLLIVVIVVLFVRR